MRLKRRRQRRMLRVVAIVGEVGVVGYNRRPGWQNWLKSVAGVGVHGGLRPGGRIAVACGEIRVISCIRQLGQRHHFESEVEARRCRTQRRARRRG
jgi:hypothetical protein